MRPTESDFHIWRHSEVGRWFFDELLGEEIHNVERDLINAYTAGVDVSALAMDFANKRGLLDGLELARILDPWSENETESHRETPPDQNGD